MRPGHARVAAALATALAAAAIVGTGTGQLTGGREPSTHPSSAPSTAHAGASGDRAAVTVRAPESQPVAFIDAARLLVADVGVGVLAQPSQAPEEPTRDVDRTPEGDPADPPVPVVSDLTAPGRAAVTVATVVAVVAVTVLLAALAFTACSRDHRDRGDADPPATGPDRSDEHAEDPPPTGGSPDQAVADRLVEELVDLVPQLPEGLAWRVERALANAGVVSFGRDGDSFDPDRHEAVGTTPPRQPDDAGKVASTVQAGFQSPRGVLRPARVVVYDAPSSRAPGPQRTPS